MRLRDSGMIRYLVSLALAAALTVAPVRAAVIVINPYISFGASYVGQDVYEIVTALGETSNIQFCLDAGDATSYTSGQKWVDLSGNAQDFFRGVGAGATTDDPTFNGVAGALSTAEYFSYDGADTNFYDTTIETWMTNAHKDNAAFTFMFWFYADTLGTTQMLTGTVGSPGTGFRVRVTTSGYISLQAFNASATVVDQDTSAELVPVTENAWNYVAVSIDEATGTDGIIFNVNGTTVLDPSTYTSPSTGAAGNNLNLAAGGGANSPLLATNRLAMVCAWSRALSESSLNSLYNATNDRGF
jgi:hypothetical protein